MPISIVPDRLIECRQKNGWNKLEASRVLGLTQSGYVRYEAGERKPTLQTVEVMALKLGTSVDYLTGTCDDPEPDRICIARSEDPELFDIVIELHHQDTGLLRRISSYLKKIKEAQT